jgi:DNA-binding CsgD family transcriptional regulator/PAS domain-containing protein
MSQEALDIDDVILQIHAAPLEPRGWQIVMRSLMDLCEAENALMLTVGTAQLPTIKSWEPSLNFNPTALQDYASHWGSQDLLYLSARQKGRIRAGLVSTETQLVGAREYSSSAYFNEFCKPHNLYSHLNVCLSEGISELGLGPSAITLYRGELTGTFGEPQAAVLQRLAPHLAIAARSTWHIEALAMAEPMYRRALDEVRIPLFALDIAGKIVLVNSAGEDLIRAKRWIAVARNHLGASGGLQSPDAFRQALAKLRAGSGTTLLLTDGASHQQAAMTTVPLGSTSPINVANKRIAGFVWIVPCAPDLSPVSNLGKLFQLSPAEVRLLQRLVEGIGLTDAAEQLHVSVHTVRTQLKVIFRKTGRRTQAQLLGLAHRMAMIRNEKAPS